MQQIIVSLQPFHNAMKERVRNKHHRYQIPLSNEQILRHTLATTLGLYSDDIFQRLTSEIAHSRPHLLHDTEHLTNTTHKTLELIHAMAPTMREILQSVGCEFRRDVKFERLVGNDMVIVVCDF